MYKRIDKRVARCYCTEGTHVVYAVPCKLNPDSPWVNGGDRISDYISDEYNTFNALVREITYYQCTNETGKYLAFYIDED